MSFVKLDCGILDSTLWADREAREIFITSLLMATPKQLDEETPAINVRDTSESGLNIPPGWYGFVPAAGPGIVRRAGIDRETGLEALERLCDIDDESRTPGFDGRRMARVDGGFLLLNYDKYRQKDHTAAERQKRYRNRISNGVTPLRAVTSRYVTQAEAEAEAESYSGDLCEKQELSSFPSSKTYESEQTGNFNKFENLSGEGRKEAIQDSSKGLGKAWHKEGIFLKLAERLDIPATYAGRVYADLSATGFVAADGTEIVSPGAFLSTLWARDKGKSERSDDGKRLPWMIEADLKRTKAEIAKITGDKWLRMSSLGHTCDWSDHKIRFESEWLKAVQALYIEAEEALPLDVQKFKEWFKSHLEEMRRDGVPDAMLSGDDYRLTKFADFMPDDDVPGFAQWDREMNPTPWVDPAGLVPDAKAEIALLKAFEKKLSAELREALK